MQSFEHKHQRNSGAVVLALITLLALPAGGQVPSATAPAFITCMTHMEGNWNDDTNINLFNRHVSQLNWGMDLFDEYGAKMTVESEIPFSTACIESGTNALGFVVARGHGVGTHCDCGMNEDLMPVADFAALLLERKTLVDQLVGQEHNRHLSGGMGVNDWVLSALMAGFEFRSSAVAVGYLAMPLEARPDGWTDTYIMDEVFHDPIPPALKDRIHPISMADATDFVEDPTGEMVVSSELHRIDSYSDHPLSADAFTIHDVSEAFVIFDEALAVRDATRVMKLNMLVPCSLLLPENEVPFRLFLDGVKTRYIDTGLLQWGTQGDVLDAFREWQDRAYSGLSVY